MSERELIRRYVGLFSPWWRGLLVGTGLAALSAAVAPATIVLLQRALDRIDDVARLPLYAAGLAGLYALDGALKLLRTWITKRVAWGVTADLRAALHERWMRLPPGEATGERLSRLTSEVDDLQYGVSGLVTLIKNPLTVGLLGLTAAAIAPTLALAAIVFFAGVVIVGRWGGRRVRRRAAEARDARAALTSLAQEQLTGLRTIQAFSAEDPEGVRFRAVAEADRGARVRLDVERLLPSVASQVAVAVAIGALLWLGGARVAAGALSAASLVAFGAALALIVRPLSGLAEGWALVQRSLAALEKVHGALGRPIRGGGGRAAPAGPLSIAWEGVHVDFGEGPVLRGATLAVGAGEKLALVGASGAGKTTLLRLVGRHLEPDAGRVRLGGVDVRRLALRELRRSVAVVDQEGFLFSRTIAENVAIGRPEATGEEIREALAEAGALGFVDALPDGVQTRLDERGHRLSAGQRQRLCLARALLTGARVLLLDEPTSAVDGPTERAVLDAVARLDRTVILVVHDLRAARIADRIAVVEGGRVREVGSHAELLAFGGHYAALWRTPGEA